MKTKRVWFFLVSAMMCMLLMSVAVSASGAEQPGTVVDGSALIQESSSDCQVYLEEGANLDFGTPAITSDPVFPVLGSEQVVVDTGAGVTPYGYYLAAGGCGISRLQDNIARVDGYTNCYRQAEYVYLGLYMDRLENGTWHTVWYKDYDAENAYRISYAINVLVKPGYYYRIRAYHLAQTGDVREGNASFTDGVAFGL